MQTKTHRLVKEPRISSNKLADYMSASEQARRTILRSCKYQPIAAVLQHLDARRMIAESLHNGKIDDSALNKNLDIYKGKITDTEFEEATKTYNIDYVENLQVMGLDKVEGKEFKRCKQLIEIEINTTQLKFWPDMHVARTNTKNNRKIGAIFLRYSKSAALPQKTALFQAALTFGCLKMHPFEEPSTPELALCQIIDAYNGKVHVAPTNAVYQFNEMKAALGSIANQWANIEPPSNAIF